jgi:cell division protein FtsB
LVTRLKAADCSWDQTLLVALAHSAADDIERLMEIIESQKAEIERLRALVTRLTDVAQDLASGLSDPGSEALAAIHCGRYFIYD